MLPIANSLAAVSYAFSVQGVSHKLYASPGRSWDAAQAACSSDGMRLVTLNSATYADELHAAVRSYSAHGYWIGLNDRAVEGQYVWDGTSSQIAHWQRWISGQPDNAGNSEDCVQLIDGSNANWNDIGCGAILAFVCSAGGLLSAPRLGVATCCLCIAMLTALYLQDQQHLCCKAAIDPQPWPASILASTNNHHHHHHHPAGTFCMQPPRTPSLYRASTTSCTSGLPGAGWTPRPCAAATTPCD